MKSVNVVLKGFGLIKSLCRGIRIYYRLCISEFIMTRIHIKLINSMLYHYKTNVMVYQEQSNPMLKYCIREISNNNPLFVKHQISEETLSKCDDIFMNYFNTIQDFRFKNSNTTMLKK